MELSIITSKRVLGVVYLFLLLIIINIFIKYVIDSLVAFCVIYTITDLYKKRKRYTWIVKIITSNVMFLSYSIIGEATISNILCVKQKNERKLKQKKI